RGGPARDDGRCPASLLTRRAARRLVPRGGPGAVRALSLAAHIAVVGVLTLAALALGEGDVFIAIVPVLVLALLHAISWLPLRYPVLVITFLALTLENPAETPAAGLWKSPFYPLGEVLFGHLNQTFPEQGWMIFSGFDALLVYLLALGLLR